MLSDLLHDPSVPDAQAHAGVDDQHQGVGIEVLGKNMFLCSFGLKKKKTHPYPQCYSLFFVCFFLGLYFIYIYIYLFIFLGDTQPLGKPSWSLGFLGGHHGLSPGRTPQIGGEKRRTFRGGNAETQPPNHPEASKKLRNRTAGNQQVSEKPPKNLATSVLL